MELRNSGRRSQHGLSGCKVSIHKHVNALRLLLILELPDQPRIALQLSGNLDHSKLHEFRGFRHLLQCCLDTVGNVWTVECDVLFKSRCSLHNLGLSILQFTVDISIVFPNVLRAWNCRSCPCSQVKQFQQLSQQSRVCLPGESIASPTDDT